MQTCKEKQKQDEKSCGSSDKDKKTSEKEETTKAPLIPPIDTSPKPDGGQERAMVPPSGVGHLASQFEFIWPKDFINNVVDKYKGDSVNELLRALSSTASVVQMRDLLTEPSFPPLLPVERQVELGCLPPPDSAAFEAVMNLSASVKNLMVDGKPIDPSLTMNLSQSVVKLFEESERTLFLQYALFRLCEMSVNSPAEFRNVYPVIIHDIVRRTAEMSQLATIEAEKTKRKELELEIQKIKLDKEELYRSCIKAKLSAGLTENGKIISDCRELVNSKSEEKGK